MNKLKFKTFIWPANPEIYREELVREAQYVKDDGDSVFSGMGPMKRVISGSGAFTGSGAYTSFSALAALFSDTQPGLLVHPVFGNRTVFFTGLEMTQSPQKDYVAYSFSFTETDANGAVPK
jgi:prophage DNA circulation protein